MITINKAILPFPSEEELVNMFIVKALKIKEDIKNNTILENTVIKDTIEDFLNNL